MDFSIFAYLLQTERHRQRAAFGAGFSFPVMSEMEVPLTHNLLLATNTKGVFVQTYVNHEGFARYGFSAVPLSDEPKLLTNLHDTLLDLWARGSWLNRFSNVQDALGAMRSGPFPPKTLVVSEDLFADRDAKGSLHVGDIEGVRVLCSKLPIRTALLFSDPASVGVYTRIGDYLGILLFGVDQTISVVSSE